MRKWRITLYVFSFLFLAFIASFLWSIYTVTGTSLLMKGMERALSGTVEMKKVGGRIGSSLHVEGFRLSLDDLTVTVDSADLEWQPSRLITGKLVIASLRARGISITDSGSEDTPVNLLLPEVSRWFTALTGWIQELTINGLKYAAAGGEPVSIDSISTTVLWDRGVLYLGGVSAKTARGTVTGTVTTNLVRPALRAQLRIILREKAAGMDTLSLDARLPASTGEEQIAGPVALTAAAGNRELYSLRCRVGIARHAIGISEAKFSKKNGKGDIEAKGTVDLSGKTAVFSLFARITGLDLAPEVAAGTDLSGNIEVAGSMEDFKGTVNLKNRGASWKAMELKGNIAGGSEGIELKDLTAKLLDGTVLGNISASWADETTVAARLTGKALNPARIRQGLEGNLNFQLKGEFQLPGNRPMRGSVTAAFRESRFQKKALSADLDASLSGETVRINKLAVKGNGFALTAGGILQERLSWDVRIDDASKLLPGAAGNLLANGWARWLNGEPAGALAARGKNISYGGASVSSFTAAMQMPKGYKGDLDVEIAGRGIRSGALRADTFSLEVKGTTGDHRITVAAARDKDRMDGLAQGKYADGAWQGRILKVSGSQVPFAKWDLAGPASVSVSKKRVSLSPFVLTSKGGEKIDIGADIAFEPMVGFASAKWQEVNLAQVGRFTGQSQLEGRTSGTSRVQWLRGNRLALSGEISASGAFSQGSVKAGPVRVNGRVNWEGSGLLGSFEIDLGDRGRINGRVLSKQPAAFQVPRQGSFQATWKTLDIAMLQPMLGDALHVKGRLSGEISGSLLPGSRFDLTGRTDISGGSFSWRSAQGEVTAPLKEAAVDWVWKDTSLKGKASLALAGYGHAEAAFQVPLAARLPPAMDKGSPSTVSLRGTMSEKGLLAALFPGLAEETRGQVDFDLTAGGTPADPRINGRLSLKGAAAYLPPAGIHLKDVSADVLFDNKRATLSSLTARSGSGYIKASGTAQHQAAQITAFEMILKGDRFEAVNLPELQASVSPDLTFAGNTKKISVRGSVLIPQALVREEHKETLIKPSSDVIVKGRGQQTKSTLPFTVDVAVPVILGDKVVVKAYGIDTGLAGKVTITMKDVQDIRASGGISTVKGKFDAYGVKLDIRRGRIAFGGGPLDRASLDILALRKVSDVSAGVLVTGTPASPLVNLYSEPAMPDMDILSYMVLGRSRGTTGKSDTALLARAASGLIAGGKASAIQKQLGLDVIDVESKDGDISKSIVKIGKYLSPKLYISYGRSIYTGENLFGIRYSVSRRVDVESTTGSASSAAIYYKIEFN